MEYTSLADPGALRESPTSASHLTVGTGITGVCYKPKPYTGSGDSNSGHAYMAIAKASAPPKVSFKAILLPEDTQVLAESKGLHTHLSQATQVLIATGSTPVCPKHQLQGILPPLLASVDTHTLCVCVYKRAHTHTAQSKSYKNRIK